MKCKNHKFYFYTPNITKLSGKNNIFYHSVLCFEIYISKKLFFYLYTFLVHHPYLNRADVPAEMVTASGSGLDPNITPQCAYVQVKRVAQARGLTEKQVRAIVDKSIEKPFLGLLGTEKVNVLKLNIALEESNK